MRIPGRIWRIRQRYGATDDDEAGQELAETGQVSGKTKGEGKKRERKGESVPRRFWRQHGKQFRALLPYLWPKGHPGLRVRLVFALFFLVLSKLASAASPIASKYAVDFLSQERFKLVVYPVLVYGFLRFTSQFAQELRDILFQHLAAHATRQISRLVYDHVQARSASQPGGSRGF